MQFKEWSGDFELGIGVIDDDHKTLFRTIRQLGEQIAQKHKAGIIDATIKSLTLYVNEHFEREERFMLRSGYPDFDAHKKLHDEFRDSIISLRNFYGQYPDAVDAQKIVAFLETWLLEHIGKVDRAYIPYLLGEKQGDPTVARRLQEKKARAMINLPCPVDKEDHVKHFITLISEGSEEGLLIEAAVEKITKTQQERRESKAKNLFGR